VAKARKELDLAKNQLYSHKTRHQMVEDETERLVKQADKIAEASLIKKHEKENVQNEVTRLQREVDIVKTENHELEKALHHEKDQRDTLVGIITKAQQELHAQLHDLNLHRKEARSHKKNAENLRFRVEAFQQMNRELMSNLAPMV